MATTKVTVTMPDELVAYIREQVAAGRFESVSAFVTRAADSLRTFDPLDLLITSMIAEGGEPDAATYARLEAAEQAVREGSTDHAA